MMTDAFGLTATSSRSDELIIANFFGASRSATEEEAMIMMLHDIYKED